MTLSPNDIRNYEFQTQMRGYAKEEVDSFLDEVSAALEAAKQENLKLSMEIDSVKSQLSTLKEFEDSIKKAAIDARHNADMTINKSKDEAERILSEAKAEAEDLVLIHRQELSEIEGKTTKAEEIKSEYLTRLRELIESHLALVDNLTQSLPKNDGEAIVVTDSSEVDRQKMETIATVSGEMESPNVVDGDVMEGTGFDTPTSKDEVPVAETHPSEPTPTPDEQAAESPSVEEPQVEKPIDPELAAALEQYQSKADIRIDDQAVPDQPNAESTDTTPVDTELAQTVSSEAVPAEDTSNQETEPRPVGFVTNRGDVVEESTGKIKIPSPDKAKAATKGEGMNPDLLAEELDNVVAKFEEEMDKAAKN